MLAATSAAPGQVLGAMPPRWADVTVERVAINAVMAGCRPEYLPIVLAAISAFIQDEFNPYTIQATTNPAGPALIVNGPIAGELEINCGYNALGQGWRANATIGRAVRLCLVNIGGAFPGTLDRATQGYPGKYTFCFAENEVLSPWEPLHVERGFAATENVVSVFQATGTLNILDAASTNGTAVLTTIAASMTAPGTNNMQFERGEALLILGPEHAATIARDSLSKEDVKRFLHLNARRRASDFPPELRDLLTRWRSNELKTLTDTTPVPLTEKWEQIVVVVAGGAGSHSTFVPGFSDGWLVSRSIDQWSSS